MTLFRVLGCVLLLVLGGCADLGYYLQSAGGHLQMMRSARPVEQWLAEEQTPLELKQRLQLAQRIRRFAVTQLHLPDNASYQRYADLQRSAVVWNVVAAPEFSLKLKTWCFPVTGCVGYRGYFNEQEAQAMAQQLKEPGWEVSVYGVPAYSTLGWMNWVGGDPLLNTFIRYPEGELARLIFHELAHQVLYLKDDTVFNESFATAVERLGAARWLASQATPQARDDYARHDARRRAFRALTQATRERLVAIYPQDGTAVPDRAALLLAKQQVMQQFRQDYAELRQGWDGYAGYDSWVANANNAAFGAQAAYDELVSAFEALFERQGADWPRFYDAVRELAQKPLAQRRQILKQLAPEQIRG